MKRKIRLNIDLPVISKREGSVNVEYKGVNVYIGISSHGGFVCLPSEDMNEPVYKGGFLDLYPSDGENLSDVLERQGVA